MKELTDSIQNKTNYLTWEFVEEEITKEYFYLTSIASIGDIQVSYSRYVHTRDKNIDLLSQLIINRVINKINSKILDN